MLLFFKLVGRPFNKGEQIYKVNNAQSLSSVKTGAGIAKATPVNYFSVLSIINTYVS